MNASNPDPFEERLRRQPLRQPPQSWRAEILAAARQASTTPGYSARGEARETLAARLGALLWPSPAAWAGLAAIWLAIVGFNLATSDKPPVIAKVPASSAPQLYFAFRDQNRLLKDLIGPAEPVQPPAPKRREPPSPQPRSERRTPFASA